MFNVTKNWAIYTLFLYKQHQAEIGQKNKQKLSNTLKLNFCYLKLFTFFIHLIIQNQFEIQIQIQNQLEIS